MAEDDRTLIGDRRALAEVLSRESKAYVIVLAGPSVGEMFRLTGATIIGRGESAQVRIHDAEISREHARVSFDGDSVVIEDLGSTNGTFVNRQQVERAVLVDGDKIQVGTTTILKFSYHDDLEEKFQRQLYESALRDALTGAHNRKFFQERLELELAFARRHGTALSLAMLDVDHFKQVDDTHGHPAGDRVLQHLSRLVAAQIRREDLFARWGGEEFALLLRGIEIEAAVSLANRICTLVSSTPFDLGDISLPVTVSIGVASVSEATHGDLVQAADTALYEAKRAGRNRVAKYEPSARD